MVNGKNITQLETRSKKTTHEQPRCSLFRSQFIRVDISERHVKDKVEESAKNALNVVVVVELLETVIDVIVIVIFISERTMVTKMNTE